MFEFSIKTEIPFCENLNELGPQIKTENELIKHNNYTSLKTSEKKDQEETVVTESSVGELQVRLCQLPSDQLSHPLL